MVLALGTSWIIRLLESIRLYELLLTNSYSLIILTCYLCLIILLTSIVLNYIWVLPMLNSIVHLFTMAVSGCEPSFTWWQEHVHLHIDFWGRSSTVSLSPRESTYFASFYTCRSGSSGEGPGLRSRKVRLQLIASLLSILPLLFMSDGWVVRELRLPVSGQPCRSVSEIAFDSRQLLSS